MRVREFIVRAMIAILWKRKRKRKIKKKTCAHPLLTHEGGTRGLCVRREGEPEDSPESSICQTTSA